MGTILNFQENEKKFKGERNIHFTITVQFVNKWNDEKKGKVGSVVTVHIWLGNKQHQASPMSFLRKKKLWNVKWSKILLCQVIVYLRVALVPLQILSVNQTFNPFLQISWFYRKFELFTKNNPKISIYINNHRTAHIRNFHSQA